MADVSYSDEDLVKAKGKVIVLTGECIVSRDYHPTTR